MSTREKTDVLIVGGGIAGLVAAAAFGRAGFETVLVDPAQPITDDADPSADLRSTAFLRPARDLFEHIGIWGALKDWATPLEALRIIDTVGNPPEPRDQRLFRGEDLDYSPFGWNFLNWKIRAALLEAIQDMPRISLRYGTGFKSLLTRTNGAIVGLSDGARIEAKLVIGADGRASPLREAAGITVQTTQYGQKALAFTATHDAPHDNISTEIYHQGGPFTMVPLPDLEGRAASAIVWMNKGPRAQTLLTMDEVAFNAEMAARSCDLFGEIKLASRRAAFPIITQRARTLTAERTALIAEAAHVLPPIGAQGLNTSLNDIAALLSAAEADPAHIGSAAMLEIYEKARLNDIKARARAIDLFNRVTRAPQAPLQALRLAGLKAVHDIAPLRRRLMRAGMEPL
ncbi:MAG: 2-octaprenyl-6-methoxyphenol hydroxylase [Halocynthiibacter sp.]|jgi:2-octaprenyl-6-methoxyphenol hydroxylase